MWHIYSCDAYAAKLHTDGLLRLTLLNYSIAAFLHQNQMFVGQVLVVLKALSRFITIDGDKMFYLYIYLQIEMKEMKLKYRGQVWSFYHCRDSVVIAFGNNEALKR